MDATPPATTTADPGPGPVMTILAGRWQSTILLTAVESDLFTSLSGGPATAVEISDRLGYQMPGARAFLSALTGVGLLVSQGGKLRNSPVADRFLVRGRPEYLGGYLSFCARELNPAWDTLGAALRTAQPQNPAAVTGNPYDSLYQDEAGTDAFLDSMDLLTTPTALRLCGLDWSRYTSFVDVGGARGNLAHHLVSGHPHLAGTVFDLPALKAAFVKHMTRRGRPTSISFHGGDFFTDPLPEADVVILGHVLHNWGESERVRLLHKAHQAVRPGGAVFIYDPMASDDYPSLNAALAGLSMLVWSAGGHEYSADECHAWLTATGFRPETVGPVDAYDDVLVIGHKDR